MLTNLTFNQILTTSEVAKNYAVSSDTIRDHLNNHNDEFIENIHYFYTINPRFKTKILNWTLEGVYMLGFFIKSEQAKIYRKKVAKFLRICKERQDAKFREKIIEQTDKIANLNSCLEDKEKHHHYQIIGYKSQISQKNTQLAVLKDKLVKYESNKDYDYKASFKKAIRQRDYYFDEFRILKQKENKSISLLNNVKLDLEKAFSKLGAIMAYISDNDEFFIKRNFKEINNV